MHFFNFAIIQLQSRERLTLVFINYIIQKLFSIINISNKPCQFRRTDNWVDDTSGEPIEHQQVYRSTDSENKR